MKDNDYTIYFKTPKKEYVKTSWELGIFRITLSDNSPFISASSVKLSDLIQYAVSMGLVVVSKEEYDASLIKEDEEAIYICWNKKYFKSTKDDKGYIFQQIGQSKFGHSGYSLTMNEALRDALEVEGTKVVPFSEVKQNE